MTQFLPPNLLLLFQPRQPIPYLPPIEKPKLPAQFKSAESGGVPFAVILGEDELAQEKVKIKELGLPEGHAEKDGILVNISDLATEVKKRLAATTAPGLVIR